MDLHRLRTVDFDNISVNEDKNTKKEPPGNVYHKSEPQKSEDLHKRDKIFKETRVPQPSKKICNSMMRKSTSDISQISMKNQLKKHKRKTTLSLSDIKKSFKDHIYYNRIKHTNNLTSGDSEYNTYENKVRKRRKLFIKHKANVSLTHDSPRFPRRPKIPDTNDCYREDSPGNNKSSEDIFGVQRNYRLFNSYNQYRCNTNYYNNLKQFKRTKMGWFRKKQHPYFFNPCNKLKVLSSGYDLSTKENSLLHYNIWRPYERRNGQTRVKVFYDTCPHDCHGKEVSGKPMSVGQVRKCCCDAAVSRTKSLVGTGCISRCPNLDTPSQKDKTDALHGAPCEHHEIATSCHSKSLFFRTPHDHHDTAFPHCMQCRMPFQSNGSNKVKNSRICRGVQIENQNYEKRTCIKNQYIRMYSNFFNKMSAFYTRPRSFGKAIMKCLLFGLLIIVWCPCMLAIGLWWMITYPLKVHRVLSIDNPKTPSTNHCLFNKLRKKFFEKENDDNEYLHQKQKGILATIVNWSSRTAGNIVNTLLSVLKINKSKLGSDTSFFASKQLNRRKKYSLRYTPGRGWVMKSARSKASPYDRNQIVHNMQYDCRIHAIRENLEKGNTKAINGKHPSGLKHYPVNDISQTRKSCFGSNHVSQQVPHDDRVIIPKHVNKNIDVACGDGVHIISTPQKVLNEFQLPNEPQSYISQQIHSSSRPPFGGMSGCEGSVKCHHLLSKGDLTRLCVNQHKKKSSDPNHTFGIRTITNSFSADKQKLSEIRYASKSKNKSTQHNFNLPVCHLPLSFSHNIPCNVFQQCAPQTIYYSLPNQEPVLYQHQFSLPKKYNEYLSRPTRKQSKIPAFLPETSCQSNLKSVALHSINLRKLENIIEKLSDYLGRKQQMVNLVELGVKSEVVKVGIEKNNKISVSSQKNDCAKTPVSSKLVSNMKLADPQQCSSPKYKSKAGKKGKDRCFRKNSNEQNAFISSDLKETEQYKLPSETSSELGVIYLSELEKHDSIISNKIKIGNYMKNQIKLKVKSKNKCTCSLGKAHKSEKIPQSKFKQSLLEKIRQRHESKVSHHLLNTKTKHHIKNKQKCTCSLNKTHKLNQVAEHKLKQSCKIKIAPQNKMNDPCQSCDLTSNRQQIELQRSAGSYEGRREENYPKAFYHKSSRRKCKCIEKKVAKQGDKFTSKVYQRSIKNVDCKCPDVFKEKQRPLKAVECSCPQSKQVVNHDRLIACECPSEILHISDLNISEKTRIPDNKLHSKLDQHFSKTIDSKTTDEIENNQRAANSLIHESSQYENKKECNIRNERKFREYVKVICKCPSEVTQISGLTSNDQPKMAQHLASTPLSSAGVEGQSPRSFANSIRKTFKKLHYKPFNQTGIQGNKTKSPKKVLCECPSEMIPILQSITHVQKLGSNVSHRLISHTAIENPNKYVSTVSQTSRDKILPFIKTTDAKTQFDQDTQTITKQPLIQTNKQSLKTIKLSKDGSPNSTRSHADDKAIQTKIDSVKNKMKANSIICECPIENEAKARPSHLKCISKGIQVTLNKTSQSTQVQKLSSNVSHNFISDITIEKPNKYVSIASQTSPDKILQSNKTPLEKTQSQISDHDTSIKQLQIQSNNHIPEKMRVKLSRDQSPTLIRPYADDKVIQTKLSSIDNDMKATSIRKSPLKNEVKTSPSHKEGTVFSPLDIKGVQSTHKKMSNHSKTKLSDTVSFRSCSMGQSYTGKSKQVEKNPIKVAEKSIQVAEKSSQPAVNLLQKAIHKLQSTWSQYRRSDVQCICPDEGIRHLPSSASKQHSKIKVLHPPQKIDEQPLQLSRSQNSKSIQCPSSHHLDTSEISNKVKYHDKLQNSDKITQCSSKSFSSTVSNRKLKSARSCFDFTQNSKSKHLSSPNLLQRTVHKLRSKLFQFRHNDVECTCSDDEIQLSFERLSHRSLTKKSRKLQQSSSLYKNRQSKSIQCPSTDNFQSRNWKASNCRSRYARNQVPKSSQTSPPPFHVTSPQTSRAKFSKKSAHVKCACWPERQRSIKKSYKSIQSHLDKPNNGLLQQSSSLQTKSLPVQQRSSPARGTAFKCSCSKRAHIFHKISTHSPSEQSIPKDRISRQMGLPHESNQHEPQRRPQTSDDVCHRESRVVPPSDHLSPPSPIRNICPPTCLSHRPQLQPPDRASDYPTIILDPLQRRYAIAQRKLLPRTKYFESDKKKIDLNKSMLKLELKKSKASKRILEPCNRRSKPCDRRLKPCKRKLSKAKHKSLHTKVCDCWKKVGRAIIDADANVWPHEIICNRNMFLHTLRRKPCLCIHKCCPSLYPCCITFCSTMRSICSMFMYAVTLSCWSPLICCFVICCESLVCSCFYK